jgi:tetratricopeptide (TPR) repeat protein
LTRPNRPWSRRAACLTIARVLDRLEKLHALLEKSPNDTFLLYAIALEHKKAKAHAQATEWFARVTAIDPSYCAAFHMAGQTHEDAGQLEEAKKAYRDGIAAAVKKGDTHAAGEMQAALDFID